MTKTKHNHHCKNNKSKITTNPDTETEPKPETKTMVAISLYRGNMHRVPSDVPRRWLMPTPQISLKDFRTLLNRRSKALSLLPSSSTSSSGNPNSLSSPPPPELENPNLSIKVEEPILSPVDQVDALIDQVKDVVDDDDDDDDKIKEKVKEDEITVKDVAVENLALEGDNKSDLTDEKEKRKKEVEEKLQVLNEKKHNLVQALKQILNAEEELKRRSNMHAGRPPLPLQVDASNDSGSMTRHATPRTGSEANVTADMEGGEGDDALLHNPQSRPLLRMSSTSPSAESALRRPPYFQHNVASHPSRAAMVAAGSPSRFAPSGNQGNPSNLLTVSVSGTNYNASSPSPAASGGTSVFREARHPSPWN